MVAFNSCSVPRNTTNKIFPARFPMPSATLRLKESRKGAPRTLGRQKVLRDLRLRKYLLKCGPRKFAAQAHSAWGPRDGTKALHGPRTQAYGETEQKKKIKKKLQVLYKTKALHGPRTQAYGETKYKKEITSFIQNQGLAWSSDSSLWGKFSAQKL